MRICNYMSKLSRGQPRRGKGQEACRALGNPWVHHRKIHLSSSYSVDGNEESMAALPSLSIFPDWLVWFWHGRVTGKSWEGEVVMRGWPRHQVVGSNRDLGWAAALWPQTPHSDFCLKGERTRLWAKCGDSHLPSALALGGNAGKLSQGPGHRALTQRAKRSFNAGFEYFHRKNCDCLRRWFCLIFFSHYIISTYIGALRYPGNMRTSHIFHQLKINLR